jgi:cation diffusion facilitator CzcD-associated flavoprotein CzcO
MSGNRQDPSVVIIGAGMTGILLFIKLREAGINNITLLEKEHTLGGTWRENTYPGVACDVPSHAYTYSFESNPDWNCRFPSGSEIYQYFKHVFYKYGVDQHTYFNEAVTSCVYFDNANGGQWTVKTSQGNTLQADLVFAATGMLHHPVLPDIPGLASFSGPAFHSARWDHTIDLSGKRIGVIGTGSTGAQLAPELINLAGTEVSVFQRTAHWIVRIKDKVYSQQEKNKFRDQPASIKRAQKVAFAIFEWGTTALTGSRPLDKLMHRLFAWNAQRTLNTSIKDPILRAKLTPDYKFGCKRVVMNDTFLDAIQKPNAHLVTDAIDHIEEQGIVTSDGTLHPLDIIVLATGFDPVAYMRPMEFIGKNGLTIEQAWENKIQAYRSVSIPNFPNFFLMLGPNSPIGNFSVIAMSEVQADYCLALIKQWQQGELHTIEATPEAMNNWNTMIKSKIGNTVWASGCQSWYLDKDGDPLIWPDKWQSWVNAMSQPDLNDFLKNN